MFSLLMRGLSLVGFVCCLWAATLVAYVFQTNSTFVSAHFNSWNTLVQMVNMIAVADKVANNTILVIGFGTIMLFAGMLSVSVAKSTDLKAVKNLIADELKKNKVDILQLPEKTFEDDPPFAVPLRSQRTSALPKPEKPKTVLLREGQNP